MDILPSIPDPDERYRKQLLEAGVNERLVKSGICITDFTLSNYKIIDPEWAKNNTQKKKGKE